MIKFYLSLIAEIPEVFRERTEGYLFWGLSIAVPVWIFYRPSFQPFTQTPEFSRWFVAVPIGLSVIYGMLRVNYERFSKTDGENRTLRGTLTALHNSRPRLTLREPGAIHVESVTFSAVGPQHLRAPRWSADFMKVRLVNDPATFEATAIARRVTAKISVLQDGRLLKRIDGRWSESEQPNARIVASQTITDLLEMDFPLGGERSIDIAFKIKDDTHGYLFNNDNYLAQPSMQLEKHRLEPGVYVVEVRLRAIGVDCGVRWTFKVHGVGGTIEPLTAGEAI